jgi:hypothetical protein
VSNKNYSKWLIVCALGLMGLTWDASFFFAMILGNGTVTIWETNTFVMWAEFICLSLAALFVLVTMIKHIKEGNANKAKKYTVLEAECKK